ncbi:MAG: hypothetical protein GY757_21170 [bacterium]|nr:hypothetical protein [bacterium]
MVGWDDNYSVSNFSITPPGNGAYLARNSWDTTFGNDGYFYISYYDVNMTQYFCNNAAEEVTNYGTNYQYDPLGMTNSLGYVDSVAWGANVFHARNNQPLKAVSFFIADVNTAYQVYVYKGVTPNNPTSGTLMATKTGSINYPGYYTVPLNSMVPLSLGEAFSVVVRFETSAINYPVPVEYAIDAYSSAATSNAGESYISYDGTNWEDLYSADQQINVCIKAFSAYEGAAVGMHVEKETIRTWLVSRDIAKLSLHITNNDTVNVSKILIYRQVGTNTIKLWKEVSMTEIQNGSYSCVDSYLAESAYVYKAVAVDTSGNPCGWSDVCTINE